MLKQLKNTISLLFSLFLIIGCQHNKNKITSPKTDINISFRIKSGSNKKILLSDYTGTLIDSVITDSKGYAAFKPSKPLLPGLYKLQLNPKSYINLVISYEDIKFTTFIINSADSMVVEQSEENKIYYQYLHQYKTLSKKLGLLYPVIKQYPEKDKFYNSLKNEFNTLQTNFIHNTKKIIAGKENLFAAKYIKFAGYIPINTLLTDEKQKEQILLHFFNQATWTDTSLLYSDAYSNKINAYLSLYTNQNLPQNNQEELYKSAIDSIMLHAAGNEKISDFTIKYLTDAFEKQKMEDVLVYIGEKYIGNISCVNEELKNELSGRIGKFEHVSIGKIAPEIAINSLEGKTITLKTSDQPYTILLFWASWCPHCTDLLPKLKEYYDNYPGRNFEIYAISLDTDKAAWEKYITANRLNWINCCNLKGWNSKAVVDYNVYATPTMFILDQDGKIVSKPLTLKEIMQFFPGRE